MGGQKKSSPLTLFNVTWALDSLHWGSQAEFEKRSANRLLVTVRLKMKGKNKDKLY